MMNEQAMEKLMAAVRKAGDRNLTLEERKTAMFMWLAGADDASLMTLDKLLAAPSSAELRLIAGFRELDDRGRGATLGAIESIVSHAPGSGQAVLGRHNFFGRVHNVADTISNVYHGGKKQDGAS